MEIAASEVAGIRVLELRGRLNLDTAPLLHSAVHEALEAGSTQLLISLAALSSVDSTGVGQLVACLTSARNRGGGLKLMKPPPKIADILAITELDRVFEIFADEDSARASFARSE